MIVKITATFSTREIRNLQKSEVSSPWHAAADAFSLNLPTFEEKVE